MKMFYLVKQNDVMQVRKPKFLSVGSQRGCALVHFKTSQKHLFLRFTNFSRVDLSEQVDPKLYK